jgi:hypothetical protein
MTIGTDPQGDPFYMNPHTHGAVFGKTGTGKTTLLENIIINAIESGTGVTVLDPHGGLIDRILDLIPSHRINDVILLDPTAERIVGVHALEAGDDPALAAESLVRIFKSLWHDSWGPRSEWLLQGFITALMHYRKPVSLVSLHKALNDRSFRRKIADTADPILADFFSTLDGWTPRFREEALSPLINKAGRLALNPHLRASLGQASPTLSFQKLLDNRQILLCKLSKGQLGDASSLIGSIIVAKLSQAALARGTAARAPHLLVADEIQNFIHGVDFSTILAETRKYGLHVFMATQTLAQLNESTRSAVYGNCGTLVAFRTSGEDGDILHRELATDIQRPYFQNIPNYQCLVRTMLEAGYPTATHLIGASAPRPATGRRGRVMSASLRRWGRPRKKVDQRITRHLRK